MCYDIGEEDARVFGMLLLGLTQEGENNPVCPRKIAEAGALFWEFCRLFERRHRQYPEHTIDEEMKRIWYENFCDDTISFVLHRCSGVCGQILAALGIDRSREIEVLSTKTREIAYGMA